MSLSMPNTCRIDTFMSGRPGSTCVARLFIAPPWPRNAPRPGLVRACDSHRVGSYLAETPRRGESARSAPAYGLQVIVGLDDLPQPALVGTIAAVGVGMMALHQELEPRLDLGRAGAALEPERVERLALGVANETALRRGGRRTPGPEQSERIVRHELPMAVLRAAILSVHSDLPGGPVARDRLLLVTGDRVFAHSGEQIVGLIILAHVMQTEAPVFALAQPALGRAMGGILSAVGPIATRYAGRWAAVLRRLDPDAIENGRVELHGRRLCETDALAGKRLRGGMADFLETRGTCRSLTFDAPAPDPSRPA